VAKQKIPKKTGKIVANTKKSSISVPSHNLKSMKKVHNKQAKHHIKTHLDYQYSERKKEQKTRKWFGVILYVFFAVIMLIIIFLLLSFVFSSNISNTKVVSNPLTQDQWNLYNYLTNNMHLIGPNNTFNITAYNKLKNMSPEEIKLNAQITRNFCIVLYYPNGSVVTDSSGKEILFCTN